MIVTGTAAIVAVMSGLLALAAGLEAAKQQSSREDRGVVLRTGSVAENTSFYSGTAVGRLLQLDHVDFASGELLIHLPLPSFEREDWALVILRGLDQSWRAVRAELNIIAGREFEPGKTEVIVGRALLAEYPGLAVGDAVPIYNGALTVVGHFEAEGGLSESELLTDLAMLQNAYNRGNTVNAVRMQLSDASSADTVQAQIDSDPGSGVTLVMEEELHSQHIAERKATIEAFAYWILGIMAVGAVVASLSTMYSAVQSRTKEIATLRALGFGITPVVASILTEALLLAVLGAGVGSSLVYALFNDIEASTRGSMGNALVFAFRLTPGTLLLGAAIALALGLVSGLAAGIRASHIPIVRALIRR